MYNITMGTGIELAEVTIIQDFVKKMINEMFTKACFKIWMWFWRSC